MLEQNQLEDIITDIYDKKAKHEAASRKRLTMMSFIHTYFNMRFGSTLAD